jgi:hypothetical protein
MWWHSLIQWNSQGKAHWFNVGSAADWVAKVFQKTILPITGTSFPLICLRSLCKKYKENRFSNNIYAPLRSSIFMRTP